MHHWITKLPSSMVVVLLCAAVAGCSTTASEQVEQEHEPVEPEYISDDEVAELEDEGLPFYATGSIAIIDGELIDPGDFNDAVRDRTERIPGGLPPQMIDQFKEQTIDFFIEQYLVNRVLDQQDIEVTEDDIDEAHAEFRQQFADREAYEVQLEHLGLTDDDIRQSLEDDVELENYLATQYDLDVSEQDVEQFYDDNRQRFQRREEVRARHILIEAPEDIDEDEEQEALARAGEIYEEASAGADFVELAQQQSEGPTAADGGELGTFPREQMVEPFTVAVFDELEVGEISEPVRTEFGFHIIEKLEHHEGGPKELDEVRSDIEMELRNQRRQEAFDDFIEERRAEAEIEVFDENIEVADDLEAEFDVEGDPDLDMEPVD